MLIEEEHSKAATENINTKRAPLRFMVSINEGLLDELSQVTRQRKEKARPLILLVGVL